MSAAEMGNMLTITGAELKALLQKDDDTREKVTTSAFAAWRPGAGKGAPLRVVLLVEPGDSNDSVQVQSETLRMGKMECMVSVDCLDESFLEEKATDWQDLTRSRWIAAEHCSMSPVA